MIKLEFEFMFPQRLSYLPGKVGSNLAMPQDWRWGHLSLGRQELHQIFIRYFHLLSFKLNLVHDFLGPHYCCKTTLKTLYFFNMFDLMIWKMLSFQKQQDNQCCLFRGPVFFLCLAFIVSQK